MSDHYFGRLSSDPERPIWEFDDLTIPEARFAAAALRQRDYFVATDEWPFTAREHRYFALSFFDEYSPTVRLYEYLYERGLDRLPWQNCPRDLACAYHCFRVLDTLAVSA